MEKALTESQATLLDEIKQHLERGLQLTEAVFGHVLSATGSKLLDSGRVEVGSPEAAPVMILIEESVKYRQLAEILLARALRMQGPLDV